MIADCPDLDGTIGDIPLALNLDASGEVQVLENGVVKATFPPYSADEMFRIHVVDHNDDTADISFSRLDVPCEPGVECLETVFYTHPVGTGPSYPLRVDATFREENASLINVAIMRIK